MNLVARTACLLVLNLLCLTSTARAEEINVAVASNFTATMKAIVAEFEKSSGHHVNLSLGASGKFYAQIKNGAPFHAFFSADQAKPEALEQDGLTVPESRFTYAIGALALWSIKAGFVDDNATKLKSGNFNKLALANPRLAPYGVAAIEVLDHLQLREETGPKWVLGENIAQTYQFVHTGNADMGFVALSQIIEQGLIKKGSGWIIPDSFYTPVRQDAVLLQHGKDSHAAHALLDFVRSSNTARKIIEDHGYKIPAITNKRQEPKL